VVTALATVGPSALWYLTRATGAVVLVLLTVSLVLGIANVGRLQTAGWPRFVIEGIHRNASMLALAVLVVHVVTSVLDPFASIHVIDAVVPFTSVYRPVWLGLGAFASDLMIAIALTSVVRRRLGHRMWRATHWLAYLCWPVAVLHAVGTGSDIKQLWLQALLAACILGVIGSVWARVGIGWPARRRLRGTAFAASIALPAAFVVWLPTGPLAANWSRRAGTPAAITQPLSSSASSAASGPAASAPARPPTAANAGASSTAAFSAAVSGTATERPSTGGLSEVDISLTVANPSLTVLQLKIIGKAAAGGGVDMTSSAASLGSASSPLLYQGSITGLEGTLIRARVVSATGRSLRLDVALTISSGGAATGTLRVGSRERSGERSGERSDR
jgi:sulfoxide reductase heme-binding subunit YedZ